MGNIYVSAFLNIAAAASSDGSGGCFVAHEGLTNQAKLTILTLPESLLDQQ
jgi:hypothetical protein